MEAGSQSCEMCGWKLDLLCEAVDALERCVKAAEEMLAVPMLGFAQDATTAQGWADHFAAEGCWGEFSKANFEAVKARMRIVRATDGVGAKVFALESAKIVAAGVLDTIRKATTPAKPKKPLIRACAWCWLDLADDEKKKRVHPLDCETHGICETCSRKLLEEDRREAKQRAEKATT